MLFFSSTAFAEKPHIDGIAPDLTLSSNGQYNLRLSEQKGYIVVMVFWSSWCGSCVDLLTALNERHEAYKEKGVKIWAIGLDKDRDEADKHLAESAPRLTLLYDDQFFASQRYDIGDLPSTAVVDRDGMLRFLNDGYKPADIQMLDQLLKKLVSE